MKVKGLQIGEIRLTKAGIGKFKSVVITMPINNGNSTNERINKFREPLFSIVSFEPISTKYFIKPFIEKYKAIPPLIAITIVSHMGKPSE